VLPADATTADGFYDLGIGRPRWRSLDELRAAGPSAPACGSARPQAAEVLVADSRLDEILRLYLSQLAVGLRERGLPSAAVVEAEFEEEASAGGGGLSRAAYLAQFVGSQLGGPLSVGEYERYDISDHVDAFRQGARSDVLLIGQLRKGRARHRAFLFKVRQAAPCPPALLSPPV
jgi:hypothetical protein